MRNTEINTTGFCPDCMGLDTDFLNGSGINLTVYNPAFFDFFLHINIISLILNPLVCLLGLPANIIACIILFRKEMRSSTTVFLCSLTVSDLIKILNNFLYFLCFLIERFGEISSSVHMFAIVYPYTLYIFNATSACSAWMVVALATERYIAVCHANKAKQICTVNRAVTVSLIIAIVSMAVSIPYGLKYETMTYHSSNSSETTIVLSYLWEHNAFAENFNWFFHIFRSYIPTVILSTFSSCILFRFQKTRLKSGRRRISIILLLVVAVFVFCYLPDTILSTCDRFGHFHTDYLFHSLRQLTDFMLMLNSAINVIIYCVFNKLFMKRLKQLFQCCTNKNTNTKDTVVAYIKQKSKQETLSGLDSASN